MIVVFNRARGLARQLIKSRYMSEENPFSSAQEMLAQLEAVFGDHHSFTAAHRFLGSLMFDIKQDDINAFIARVSALADEANIRISQRRSRLYTKLPPGFGFTDHLRLATVNDRVSFESFTRSLTTAVISRKEGFAYRQKNKAPKRKRKRESPSPPRHRRERSERYEARKEDSTVVCAVPQVAQIGRSEPSKEFTVPVEVKNDGIGLKTKALCDTGAGIYLSMTPEFAQRVVRSLKGKIMKLPKPLQLADFSGTSRGVVTDYIRASLTI
ncbi:uncharacterized protein CPUR_06738 [Claviceps purpurea 20.1]|uniref:Uncharacterized protein n=1 Tax=Claviceps purpurea (strain 20.1) TaxID=1111077 RepID=M1WEL4_CLAP2|nr:uncharacterized protein CPUR_06738 [Claviceps purpurea 20.1]